MRRVAIWLCCLAPLVACGPGPGERVEIGAQLYRDHGCPLCHGPDGAGDGPLASTLVPPPRDLRDPASYDQGVSAAEVAETLATGLPRDGVLAMQPYPHIPAGDRSSIASFVVSLQEEGSPGPALLTITGAWARATPPGSEMTGAYMTLHNHGNEPVVLRQVSSGAADVVEIHRMTMAEGRMSMAPQDGLEIAPGDSVVLEPGGLHLMLIGLHQTLDVGQSVELELLPDGGPAMRVELQVSREPPEGEAGRENR